MDLDILNHDDYSAEPSHTPIEMEQVSLPCPVNLEILSLHQWHVATLVKIRKIEHLTLIQVTVTLKFISLTQTLQF